MANYVVPAYAGVILLRSWQYRCRICGSRVCGGDPTYRCIFFFSILWFPRMRG